MASREVAALATSTVEHYQLIRVSISQSLLVTGAEELPKTVQNRHETGRKVHLVLCSQLQEADMIITVEMEVNRISGDFFVYLNER